MDVAQHYIIKETSTSCFKDDGSEPNGALTKDRVAFKNAPQEGTFKNLQMMSVLRFLAQVDRHVTMLRALN